MSRRALFSRPYDRLDEIIPYDDIDLLFIYPHTAVIKKVNAMKKLKDVKVRYRQVTGLSVLALAFLVGCTASNYGRLNSDTQVTKAFQNHQTLPDHTYYYRGTQSRPFVIAGIHKDFVLDSKLWVEINPQSKDFGTLIDRVSLQGIGSTAQPWGFTITDSSGREVGVWYSAIRAAAVDVDENGRIVNLSPIRAVAIGDQGR